MFDIVPLFKVVSKTDISLKKFNIIIVSKNGFEDYLSLITLQICVEEHFVSLKKTYTHLFIYIHKKIRNL